MIVLFLGCDRMKEEFKEKNKFKKVVFLIPFFTLKH